MRTPIPGRHLDRRSWYSGFGVGVLLLWWVSGWTSLAAARNFYVSPTGSDANSGTDPDQPFATLEAARDAVRVILRQESSDPAPVTVWLRGGDHVRTRAFELGRADSGTPTAPVMWRAYGEEAPRLLGGRRLGRTGPVQEGAKRGALPGFVGVTNAAVLARLTPEAQEHVLQYDLRGEGISELGQMKSRGFGRPTTPAHAELFYGTRPMTLARWPNEGEFSRIAGFPDATAQGDDHGGKIGRLEEGFQFEGERPLGWQNPGEAWVHGYWSWDWANSYEKVVAIDRERRLVKTAPPYGLYGFRKGQRFYFLNVLEELDQPGEWFVDAPAGLLYFWPPAPATDAGSTPRAVPEVVLSLLGEPLIKLSEVSHVTFRGLILEATRASAVQISSGTSNRMAGCLIRNVGNYGVTIEGGTGHGVSGCDILDTGDGGVSLSGGDRQTLTAAGHYAENCHFQRQGRWSKCYVPAVLMSGVGLRASHNLIHDHPHCAILFTGNEHLLEYNDIHHIALETGDVGAIYTGRDYSFRGNRIRHNYIHHTGGVGMGSMGVYMDDCVSGTEVYGNVFYKVHWAMFIGGGRDHRVENNLFVDCDPAVRMDGRGLDRAPVWFNMVNGFMRERLLAMPPGLYRERYPALATLDPYYGPPEGPPIEGDAFKGVPPEGNLVARNICVGKWLEVGWHATMDMLRLESNLTNAVSSLARQPEDQALAPAFALTADSPAWSLGFQPLPLAAVGLQEDECRREVARLSREIR